MVINSGPSPAHFPVTPSDNPLPIGRGTHVDVGGTIAGRQPGDTVDDTWTVIGGVTHPLIFSYIRAAGTTATGIKVQF